MQCATWRQSLLGPTCLYPKQDETPPMKGCRTLKKTGLALNPVGSILPNGTLRHSGILAVNGHAVKYGAPLDPDYDLENCPRGITFTSDFRHMQFSCIDCLSLSLPPPQCSKGYCPCVHLNPKPSTLNPKHAAASSNSASGLAVGTAGLSTSHTQDEEPRCFRFKQTKNHHHCLASSTQAIQPLFMTN